MIGSNKNELASDERISLYCSGFLLVNALGVLGIFYWFFLWQETGSPGYISLVTALFLYVFRMFFVTAVRHRYFSHRSYEIPSRKVQFIFAFLCTLDIQQGVVWWASHHREHHSYSDTEKDVHSAFLRGIWWSHMGWLLCRKYQPTQRERVRDLEKFSELVWLGKRPQVYLAPTILGITCFLLGTYLGKEYGTSGLDMLLVGFFSSTFFLYHGTFAINSFAHLFGTTRYETGEKSKNNFFLAIITLGEGWHNNHHHSQGREKQGEKWWEIDISHMILVVLSWFRLVKLRD